MLGGKKLGLNVFLYFGNISLNLYVCNFCFIMLVVLISLSCLIYSSYYMNNELNIGYYNVMMVLFSMSMVLLLMSSSIILTVFSWEMLGITSFFLIMFFQSWESYNNSMVTVLTMRVGDMLLFMVSGMYLFVGGYLGGSYVVLNLSPWMLLLVCMTKSAQMPFSGWLPKAMSAPTPTSALVHSSTLVTAGFSLMGLTSPVTFGSNMLMVMKYVGFFTLFSGGLLATMEVSVKKIVAYSTLSHMGMVALAMGLGYPMLAWLHMVVHGLAKSLLFMCVGFMIHTMSGQQDTRYWGGSPNMSSFLLVQIFMSLMSLCGLFFISGMVSKEMLLMMSLSTPMNLYMSYMIVFSMLFTFIYSLRLWSFMFVSSYTNSVTAITLSSSMIVATMVLTSLNIIGGWWLVTNLISPTNFFMMSDSVVPFMYMLMLLFINVMLMGGLPLPSAMKISIHLTGNPLYKWVKSLLMDVKGVEDVFTSIRYLWLMSVITSYYFQKMSKYLVGRSYYLLLVILVMMM